MYTDYTKFLTTTPATVDTTLSTSGRKWASTSPVSSVGALASTLVIPAFDYPIPQVALKFYNRMFAQYNYTASQPFTITRFDSDAFANIDFGFMCIRYRVGNTVTRYLMAANPANVESPVANVTSLYTGQVIKANFCFEIWAIVGNANRRLRLHNDIVMDTSILQNPSPINQSAGSVIEPVSGNVPFTGIRNALPWAMPQAFNASACWLTN